MRPPSGDNSALPIERKRERSPLLRPWALPNGARVSRVSAKEKHKTARRKIQRERDGIEFSLSSSGKYILIIFHKADGNSCYFKY
jgi:hypothetical protein